MQLRCTAAATLLAAVLSGCVVGAPLGFSDGDSWEIPLLGADEGDELYVPVYFGNEGPFLFVLNPSNAESSIDTRLAAHLKLYAVRTQYQRVDQDDRMRHHVATAEVPSITLGTLTVRTRKFVVLEGSPWTFRGVPVLGILGRDIIDDTLIWQIDRDRSVLTLATQGHATPPFDAVAVKGKVRDERFHIPLTVAGEKLDMVANFRNGFSEVWPPVAEDAGLPRTREARVAYTDEWGERRELTAGWRATDAALGAQPVGYTVLFPLLDKRTRRVKFDGYLGQDILSRFNVTVNWHKKTIWLQKRAAYEDYISARTNRWGTQFAGCDQPACLTIKRSADGEQPSMELVRTGEAMELQYDVVLEAVDADGKRLPVPRLLASLPSGVDSVKLEPQLAAGYLAAAEVRVTDCSPYPLPCKDGNCVWTLP